MAFVNIFFIISGNIILLICAQKDAAWLTVGYGVLGFGSGSLFGNILLWLEEHFEVSSRVTSVLAMAAGLGVNLAPLIVGQAIDTYPMILIYLQVKKKSRLRFSIILYWSCFIRCSCCCFVHSSY